MFQFRQEDDLLQYWETENNCSADQVYPSEEQPVQHFKDNHFRTDDGRLQFCCLVSQIQSTLGNLGAKQLEDFLHWTIHFP